MSKAKAQKSVSRQDEAYSRILSLITGGALIPGDRLPGEVELSSRFGMSRPTVREALSRLRNAGVIIARQGAGNFVQGLGATVAYDGGSLVADDSYGRIQSLDELRNCFEFRGALEGEAAACAAKLRDKKALGAVEAALNRLEEAIREESRGRTADSQFRADYDFHMAIAMASGNPFYRRALLNLRPSMDFSIGVSRSLTLTHSAERLRLVQAEHVAVFRSIKKGDADAARRAMHTHMANACRRVFEGPGNLDGKAG